MGLEFSPFAKSIVEQKYLWNLPKGEKETWRELSKRVSSNVLNAVNGGNDLISYAETAIEEGQFLPGGRYLCNAGKQYHQTQNCLLLTVGDSREDWAELLNKVTLALMTGAGIGIVYSNLRAKGKSVRRTGGVSSGPIALIKMVNEVGRGIVNGGNRRCAIWAGLHWWHADIFEFVKMKNWIPEVRALKEKDFNFPADADMTNISVILDDDFFEAYNKEDNPRHGWARTVYRTCISQMLKTGEPGFSVDIGENTGENLRNACTEITSRDDSDICNLGSINLSRVNSLEEMKHLVEISTAFLLAGTVYSDVPYPKVDQVRTKNRRLGLGLMGISEWLIKNGKNYAPDKELEEYLKIYATSTKISHKYAKTWDLTNPVKTRAIAPNGCQHPETLVVTDDGILMLEELGNINGEKWQNLDLKVSQENGKMVKATRFFLNGEKNTKKIKLRSGVELECTPNHQYRILDDSQYVWKMAKDIKVGDDLVSALNVYHKETETELIPVKKQHKNEHLPNFPLKMNQKLAHFLGLFLADGSMHKKGIRIACNAHDEKEYREIGELGKEIFNIEPRFENNNRGCVSVYFNSSVLLRWLYTNELDKPECLNMEIPLKIRVSSRQSIKSFIEGYWRGDGSENNGNKYIDTASIKMAKQLVIVNKAIGIDCTIGMHISGLGSKIYRINLIKTKSRENKKEISEKLKNLNLGNCVIDRVVSVEDSFSLTLDLEVPETTTYISNGIVSHNTIGIVGGTSTGIEPIFCTAYKRRYLGENNVWRYQYVVDPTAKRLIDSGVYWKDIEDAYSLAENVEKRIAFQAWTQQYIDHGISSTINLPAWGTEFNNESQIENFGNMLMKYLPKLRGITTYPNGGRSGQPLEAVDYEIAQKNIGEVFYETADVCDISRGGSCGT